jgi:aminopeptidase-like protein
MDFSFLGNIINKETSGNKMYDLIEQLYPICRSITGNGVRETLSILSEIIPLNIVEVKSGEKALDWEIPLEWNIKDAYVLNEKGDKIIDFKKSNLHVLNYSIPVDKEVSLEELKEHVYTIPENPNWIPYRTSYHNRNWGFCMAHSEFKKLEKGNYHVKVDATLEPGSLTYGEYYIKGESEQEVLVSCHICHPSLCNDNLSGIAVAAFLAEILTKSKPSFSYRFLFIPGTIGSITWLSRNEDKLKNIRHGLVLTLLGDDGKLNYKKSRRGNAEIDRIVENELKVNTEDYGIIEFYPYGYDERQFCSPGYNLPVGRLSRTPHGEFPEYHTSADNLDFVKADKLAESLEFVFEVFETIEGNKKYLNLNPKGEPQLGKRGLFKKIGGESKTKDYHMALLWVLNLSDGDYSLLDISVRSGLSFQTIKEAADALKKVDLLKELGEK